MKVLIVEDEPMTADRLGKMLNEIKPGIEILAQTDTVEDTVAWLKNHTEPDLILLDIHLADASSFEIFKQVEVNCPVIFTTAYDQYAIQAFKVNSIDYLLKPVKKTELAESLKKLEKLQRSSGQILDYSKLPELLGKENVEYRKRFMIRIGSQFRVVAIEAVAYFYIDQKIVYLTTKDNHHYPVDQSLDQLEEQLDPERFFRINRAFIVSIDSIDKMIAYSKSRVKVKLNPPCELESITSTDRSGGFKEWLKGK
ncbi:MAG: LytTR family DNA-binding domain-containing protein [Bacteroidales bacterium]|nr:LytTR family DNA-binding domain-containing protein [Bacteroidales bacterium]MCF8387045.1 LytTR family DNA-binding domain-containing protein [Bacteroidales bacterium]MCF8397676.1 LytTR family DNA-binding domain-containing protein [Bacteroidales bacterium]